MIRRPGFRWPVWLVLVPVLGIVLFAEPALAACHRFTVEVDPDTVTEGRRVTVTVTRDAAVNPSQVVVSTIDGTARAESDYARTRRTVQFTTGTERSFTIATTDDDEDEQTETFRVHLSEPSGCAINQNFVLGPDARVSIRDNDAAEPTPTDDPRPSETAEESPSETESPSPSASPSPTATTSGLASPVGDEGGTSTGLIVALVAAALAMGGLGWAFARRRARTGAAGR